MGSVSNIFNLLNFIIHKNLLSIKYILTVLYLVFIDMTYKKAKSVS